MSIEIINAILSVIHPCQANNISFEGSFLYNAPNRLYHVVELKVTFIFFVEGESRIKFLIIWYKVIKSSSLFFCTFILKHMKYFTECWMLNLWRLFCFHKMQFTLLFWIGIKKKCHGTRLSKWVIECCISSLTQTMLLLHCVRIGVEAWKQRTAKTVCAETTLFHWIACGIVIWRDIETNGQISMKY